MNPYRIALILCRAVSLALWWMAGLRLMAGLIAAVVAQFGVSGLSGPPLSVQLLINSLTFVVPAALATIFLKVFAPSLAASMVGKGSFESEAIVSRHLLDESEIALSRAGAGLLLLCLGAINAVPTSVSLIYASIFERSSNITGGIMIYQIMSGFIPAVLQCVVGFVLAFSLGLRRIVKTQ